MIDVCGDNRFQRRCWGRVRLLSTNALGGFSYNGPPWKSFVSVHSYAMPSRNTNCSCPNYLDPFFPNAGVHSENVKILHKSCFEFQQKEQRSDWPSSSLCSSQGQKGKNALMCPCTCGCRGSRPKLVSPLCSAPWVSLCSHKNWFRIAPCLVWILFPVVCGLEEHGGAKPQFLFSPPWPFLMNKPWSDEEV